MLGAQALDFVTFTLASSVLPISGEANGLAVLVYLNAGLLGIVMMKLAACGLVLAFVAWRPSTWLAGVAGWSLCALGVLGACANVLSLGVSL